MIAYGAKKRAVPAAHPSPIVTSRHAKCVKTARWIWQISYGTKKGECFLKMKQLILGPVQTSVYLVADEVTGDAAVIDPADDARRILDAAARQGWTIRKVLLTHGHFDHIAALGDIVSATGAEVYISAFDIPLLRDADKNAARLFFGEDIHFDLPVTSVREGDVITLGDLRFTVAETPGHTRGSVCYFAGDTVFTGDTLFHGGYGRTDLYGGDEAALIRSLQRLAPMVRGKKIYPGHG